ncbi:MAG: hypothetical protein IPN71_20745 [Fibrobacteres bacterium]|nr:hypothetical protein [Fibrobacterota bacterium]
MTWIFFALILLPSVHASEGDLLLEGGPRLSGRSGANLDNPGIGISAAVLSSFSNRTDIGLVGAYEHQNNPTGGLDLATIAIQSWFTGFRGEICPQFGGTLGIAMDDAYNASLHVGAQARALVELKSLFRLYLGAAFGRDLGDYGSTYGRGEFGTQFRLD